MKYNGCMTDITWTLKTFNLDELTDYAKNPRSLSRRQFAQLKTSLDKFGMIDRPIINADAHHTVIGGHQRLRVLRAENVKLVECWHPSRELDAREVEELNVRLNKNSGAFDMEILANQFEIKDLVDWGFDGKDFGFDQGAQDEPDEQIDVIDLGIKRCRWSFRHGKGFLSVRSFTTRKKKTEMEYLKKIKQGKLLIPEIARELAAALTSTFGNLGGFVVTSAPEHKTGFAVALCQAVGEILALATANLFLSDIDASAKKTIFGEREEIKISGDLPDRIIWIDDALTTGRTLRTCRELCADKTFIPLVWVYDDAQKE